MTRFILHRIRRHLRSTAGLVMLIFSATVGLRLLCVAATFHGNDNVTSWEDVSIAGNLVKGKVFQLDETWRTAILYGNLIKDIDAKIPDRATGGARPTTLKQPLFPLFLAGIFYLFGYGNFLALFVVHSVLAGFTAVVLYLTLRPQFQRIAVAFALGFAIYPPFVYQCATSPESTILLLFLLALFFYHAVSLAISPTLNRFIGLGVLAGVLVMTNFGTLPFAGLAICFAALLVSDDYVTAMKRAAVSALCFSIVIAPWLYRNYTTFGRVFMRASTGHELLKSRVEAGYGLLVPEEMLLELEKRGRGLSEVEEGEMLESAITSRVRWPATVASNLFINLSHFWWETPRYRNNYSLSYMIGRRIPYYILLLLSIPAVTWRLQQTSYRFIDLRSHLFECLAILLIVTDTAVYGYAGGWNIRYHFAVELALLSFAAQAAIVLCDRVRSHASHNVPG